ncbi:MAG: insulinase family protein [Spirochaetaceae bacterium]|jgi:Zn-dependent M16 (insulinase) family peptidase|nr:insulinase family protein [Spirochaetaceae bacterium]
MRFDCRAGEQAAGFEILEIADLPEFEAAGIYARHIATGAEVFHLFNGDSENTFAFAFATSPEDSTGVAHILEHSVLCGSKNYPLKDPFIVLAQGSLQTYLNAWTFPDKTVYPASSVNEADYFNLMAVYGDAVFRPKLEEWTFMQEGHRIYFDKKTGKPEITGVVYNEMKGAYSALDEYAQHSAFSSVLGGTIYAFDSGGEPQSISGLRYEDFLAFHRKAYTPANCRVFLCGNIPVKKQLEFLDKHFFSSLAKGSRASPVALAARWNAPRRLVVPAPEGADNKKTVFISWLCGKNDTRAHESDLALAVLTEALLGHDGSPLMRALVESPLGEDLATVTGLDSELREPVWSAGLRGVERGTADEEIEALLLGELRRLRSEGIPRSEIEAALLSLEFSNREIRRSGGPWPLTLMRLSLRGWLHGAKPWETMLFREPFSRVKEEIGRTRRYLEGLLEKELLDNPHRALVTVRPEPGFLEAREKEREEALLAAVKEMSVEERAALEAKNAALERVQSEPDSPAALAAIPHISIANLDGGVELIPRASREAGGIPVLSCKLWTNGISYSTLAFPADILSESDFLYLPLFCHCVTSLGIPGMNYAEVSSLLARTVGDISASPYSSPIAPAVKTGSATAAGNFDIRGRDWVFIRMKCLDKNIESALELVSRVISEADFSDERRLRDLIIEMKNDIETSLAPNGNYYAALRCAAIASAARAKTEALGGITQIRFVRKIAARPVAETACALERIKRRIFSASGLIVHITGAEEEAHLRAVEKHLSRFGPPAPAPSGGEGNFFERPVQNEVFFSPSLQVGFAASNFIPRHFDDARSIYETALAHHLSTGALWETIRMAGGAYGARISADALANCWTFSTYRDPSPAASLEIARSTLEKAARASIDKDALEKIIIGVYAKIKHPQTAAQKGVDDFARFLIGVDDKTREARLKALLASRADDISSAAEGLLRRNPSPPSVIITSERAARAAADALKTEPFNLEI